MRICLSRFFVVVAAVLAVSAPTYAHHSPAMYDMGNSISVKGTVTSFEWANPHSMIYVDVKGDKGDMQKWIAEMGSPNRLSPAGWSKVSLKQGDLITLVGHAAKDGTHSMRLEKIVLADGKEFSPRGP